MHLDFISYRARLEKPTEPILIFPIYGVHLFQNRFKVPVSVAP
jgi:hypothetical protein